MDMIFIAALVIFGGVNLGFGIKNNALYKDYLHFVFFIAISLLYVSFINQGKELVMGLLTLVSGSLILSRFKKLTNIWYGSILVILLAVVFFVLHKNSPIELASEMNVLNNKFAIMGLLLSGITPLFLFLKRKSLERIFNTGEEVRLPILLLFSGIGLYLINLGVGQIGYFIVASIFLAHSFFNSGYFKSVAVSLLLISSASVLFHHFTEVSLNAFSGDVIFGLFMGVFIVLFIDRLKSSQKSVTTLKIISVTIVIGILITLLYVGSIFHLMGGLDSAVAVIVGLAIANVFTQNTLVVTGTASLSFAAILLLAPVFQPDNTRIDVEQSKSMDIIEESVIKELPLVELAGDFLIVKDSSIVDFMLGANNETKGSFKKVEGKVSFGEDISKTSFDIELNLNDFTTFNSFRDKSLMEAEYFDKEKYPTMSYKANELVKEPNGNYMLRGSFLMLGVSKDLDVTIRRIESIDGIRLMGEGQINRVDFGMTPSSSEGNIVSFEYNVLLKDQK